MNPITEKLLKKHAEDLDRINNQRRLWLYASSIVLIGIIFIIFGWNWIDNYHSMGIWWIVISSILVISVNWWYWTMRVIRILLQHQQVEYDLLKCILNDVNMAKDDIKFLAQKDFSTND